MKGFRLFVRKLGLAAAHRFGTRLIDATTGEDLGRVLIIPWRGKIHMVGLRRPVRPVFLPQERITYWKQNLDSPCIPRRISREKRRRVVKRVLRQSPLLPLTSKTSPTSLPFIEVTEHEHGHASP